MAPGIALSFDDYFADNWYEYVSLFDSFNVKATFYTCCYHDFTPDQKNKLKYLQKKGHEVAYHTSFHQMADSVLQKHSLKDYTENEILRDLNLMRKDGFRIENFAYPFGNATPQTDSVLIRYFHSLRKTTNIPSTSYWWTSTPYLWSHPAPNPIFVAASIDNIAKLSKARLIELLDETSQQKKVLVLYSHFISDRNGDYFVSPDMLRFIFTEAGKRHLKFYRTGDLVAYK